MSFSIADALRLTREDYRGLLVDALVRFGAHVDVFPYRDTDGVLAVVVTPVGAPGQDYTVVREHETWIFTERQKAAA